MTELRQRSPRVHDAAHLKFVRGKPCCVCGSMRNVEAAHIRLACPARGKLPTGMQEKADDRWVTSLCAYHHRTGIAAQHKISEARFWFEIHGRNPFEIAERLWKESGGADRALQLKPAKKQRATKPRDRAAPKRAFPQGRKIQSRPFEKRPV